MNSEGTYWINNCSVNYIDKSWNKSSIAYNLFSFIHFSFNFEKFQFFFKPFSYLIYSHCFPFFNVSSYLFSSFIGAHPFFSLIIFYLLNSLCFNLYYFLHSISSIHFILRFESYSCLFSYSLLILVFVLSISIILKTIPCITSFFFSSFFISLYFLYFPCFIHPPLFPFTLLLPFFSLSLSPLHILLFPSFVFACFFVFWGFF